MCFSSPVLAYGQHRIFTQPFKRVRTWSLSSRASLEDDNTTITNRPSETAEKAPLKGEQPSEDTPVATPSATVEELLSPREDTPFSEKQGKAS